MIRFAASRALVALPTIFGVAAFAFLMLRLAPGDPVLTELGASEIPPQEIAALRHSYGLDQPIPVQFAFWLDRVVHGDLGMSISGHVPVTQLIVDRLPVTLELTFFAVLISLVVGVSLGVASALHQGGLIDSGIRIMSLTGVSMPSFVIGILLLMIFGWYFPGILPYDQWVPISAGLRDNLTHLLLPSIALAVGPAMILARLGRSSMLDILSRPYVVMARAFGIPNAAIVWLDVMKNAMIPVITYAGLVAAYLVGGAIPVETIFHLPGVGGLLVNAVESQDYPLVSGILLTFSVLVVSINLAVDLVYALINPRIAHAYGGRS